MSGCHPASATPWSRQGHQIQRPSGQAEVTEKALNIGLEFNLVIFILQARRGYEDKMEQKGPELASPHKTAEQLTAEQLSSKRTGSYQR